jgi:nucleoside-diphosphate-sugar epimerase
MSMEVDHVLENWIREIPGRVVITGTGGYLGGWLAGVLRGAGVEVLGVERGQDRSSVHPTLPGDLTTPGLLDGVLAPGTVVFHLASPSSVARSVEDPRAEVRDNLLASLEVLESVRRSGARLVFASSICVADPDSPLPHAESAPLSPRSPYGACKAAVETMSRTYHACYGTDVRIARMSTIFGPGLRRFAIYDFYRKVRANPAHMEILGDGNQLRDYLYVTDAVKGLMLIALRGRPGECYHLGSGVSIQTGDLARVVARMLGSPDISIRPAGRSFPGDIARWALDVGKIRELGFHPSVDLESGLAEVLRSYAHEEATPDSECPESRAAPESRAVSAFARPAAGHSVVI